MKHQITQREVSTLDLLAVQAITLHELADGIADTMVHVLDVEQWDAEKLAAVAIFVRNGTESIESFLETLGVTVVEG